MAKRTLKDFREVTIKQEDVAGRFDFENVFGRKGPVHIEIGSGKGTFLVSQAQLAPEVNFLGIERANKYYRFAVDRLGRWGLSNVRIIRTDAAHFLSEHLTDSSIDCFHIYFPDPWPKRRHHKRRLISGPNIRQMLRCLKKRGLIKIATDHAEYFEQIKQVIAAEDHGLELVPFIPAPGAEAGEVVGTNYERKYIKDKRGIYTIAAKKI